jgi:hypothetical protein
MFCNYKSLHNKEPEQRCMTDHRIQNNPLSSVENKQRSFSNVSYMVCFTYFTIYGVIITGVAKSAVHINIYVITWIPPFVITMVILEIRWHPCYF